MTDRPGQKAHMDLEECLYGGSAIMVYDPRCDEARRNVQMASVSQLLIKTCEVLSIQPSVLFTEHESWSRMNDDDVYTFSLLDNRDFDELFNSILDPFN